MLRLNASSTGCVATKVGRVGTAKATPAALKRLASAAVPAGGFAAAFEPAFEPDLVAV